MQDKIIFALGEMIFFFLKPWLSGLHGKGSENGVPYIMEDGKMCAP